MVCAFLFSFFLNECEGLNWTAIQWRLKYKLILPIILSHFLEKRTINRRIVSAINFYLELAALISADLLFYVKDVEATSLLTDVATTHHSAALKKGMRDLVDEYDPYILLKVYVDEDFTSFFGLVNEDVPIREFEVKCTKTLKEFKSIVHTEFGVSVDQQLFWVVEAEDDGQKRPQRAIPPVDEEFRK